MNTNLRQLITDSFNPLTILSEREIASLEDQVTIIRQKIAVRGKTGPIVIALTGPSGAGKTTLAKTLSALLDIPFTENSAGLILWEDVKERLVTEFGWKKSGHAEVIKLSFENPKFGQVFQEELLKARVNLVSRAGGNAIYDRCPVDNMVYASMQGMSSWAEEYSNYFIDMATIGLFTYYDMVISVPPLDFVENNGSRIPNLTYQRVVSSVFEHYISKLVDDTRRYPSNGRIVRLQKGVNDFYSRAQNALENIGYYL